MTRVEAVSAVYQEYKQIGIPSIKLLIPFAGIMDSYKECALFCKVIDWFSWEKKAIAQGIF